MDERRFSALSKRWMLITAAVLFVVSLGGLLIPGNRESLAEKYFDTKIKTLRWFSNHPKVTDPSDAWYKGYMALKKAQQLEAAGNFKDAEIQYRSAFAEMNATMRDHPKFHTEIVEHRLRLIDRKISKLK